MNTGIKFTWERGSLNSSAIKVLDKKGIRWSYDHFLRLTIDIFGYFELVEFKKIADDIYEICTLN